MTFNEAKDVICSIFNNYWQTTSYPVIWPDTVGKPPETEIPWARVSIQHYSGGQASLASFDATKRWRRTGSVFIQIFTPIGTGNVNSYELCQNVVNAFQSAKNDCIWFRNVTLTEVGSSGAYQQNNVSVVFTYDDIR